MSIHEFIKQLPIGLHSLHPIKAIANLIESQAELIQRLNKQIKEQKEEIQKLQEQIAALQKDTQEEEAPVDYVSQMFPFRKKDAVSEKKVKRKKNASAKPRQTKTNKPQDPSALSTLK